MAVLRIPKVDADGDVLDYQGRKLAAKDRSTHEGQQAASTISDLVEVVIDAVYAALVAGTGLTKSYDDPTGLITLAASGVDLETVRDTVGSTLVATSPLTKVVSDAGDTTTIALTTGAMGAQLIAAATAVAARDLLGLVNPLYTPRKYNWDPTTSSWPTPLASDPFGRCFYSGGYPLATNPAATPAIAALLKQGDYWEADAASTVA